MSKQKHTVESIRRWIRLHDLINITKLERIGASHLIGANFQTVVSSELISKTK